MAIKTTRLPSIQFRARGYKTTATPFFLIKTKKNFGNSARVGVVVGVSVHKTAVKRNFLKRQVIAELTTRAKAGNDILIIVLPPASRSTKKQFRGMLVKALINTQ
jgi:ribonuclease P protein component